jgi:hypothetical protein
LTANFLPLPHRSIVLQQVATSQDLPVGQRQFPVFGAEQARNNGSRIIYSNSLCVISRPFQEE